MTKNKILTFEEKKAKTLEQQRMLMNLDSKRPLEKTPAYSFEIGDKVVLGNLKDVTVIGYNENKTIYELSFTNDENIDFRVASWWDVRPIMDKTAIPERVAVSGIADVSYNNCYMESLLHRYYHSGIDMSPDYQRDFVWNDADKQRLLDSVFHDGIEIGRFVLVRLSNEEHDERDCTYEILDGKQRLNCLCEFYENRFQYKGLYFNDLHPKDKYAFLHKAIVIGEVRDLTREEKLQLFLAINRGGKAMDIEHLQQVEDMLNEEMDTHYIDSDEER